MNLDESSTDSLESTTTTTTSSSSSSSSSSEDTDDWGDRQSIINIAAGVTAWKILGKRSAGRPPGPSFRSDDGFLYSQFDEMAEEWFVEEFGLTRKQFHVLEEYVVPRITEGERDVYQHTLDPRLKLAVLLRYCRKCTS